MKTLKLKISKDGQLSAIYSDDLTALMSLGQSKIRRASHVEPTNQNQTFGVEWSVELVHDGTVLGPFPSRAAALDAEVEYIERNILHVRK
jgi:hypothetical protein